MTAKELTLFENLEQSRVALGYAGHVSPVDLIRQLWDQSEIPPSPTRIRTCFQNFYSREIVNSTRCLAKIIRRKDWAAIWHVLKNRESLFLFGDGDVTLPEPIAAPDSGRKSWVTPARGNFFHLTPEKSFPYEVIVCRHPFRTEDSGNIEEGWTIFVTETEVAETLPVLDKKRHRNHGKFNAEVPLYIEIPLFDSTINPLSCRFMLNTKTSRPATIRGKKDWSVTRITWNAPFCLNRDVVGATSDGRVWIGTRFSFDKSWWPSSDDQLTPFRTRIVKSELPLEEKTWRFFSGGMHHWDFYNFVSKLMAAKGGSVSMGLLRQIVPHLVKPKS